MNVFTVPANPSLIFGSAPVNAADITRLKNMGVTHVLDLRLERPDQSQRYSGTGIIYRREPMEDFEQIRPETTRLQPAEHYVRGVTFIRDALAHGGKVYIHCAAGLQRSPSMVYAALRASGMSADEAWDAVRAARSSVKHVYIPGAEAAVPQLPRIGTAPAPIPMRPEVPLSPLPQQQSAVSRWIPVALVAVGAIAIIASLKPSRGMARA